MGPWADDGRFSRAQIGSRTMASVSSSTANHRAGPQQAGRRRGLRTVTALPDETDLAVNADSRGQPKGRPAGRAARQLSAMLSALAISIVACSTPPAKPANLSPLADGPDVTTRQVLAAVKAAEQVRTLSDAIVASLGKPDAGATFGCFDRLDTHKPVVSGPHERAGDLVFGECATGDPKGTKLMVLYGDSRAWMFAAPLARIAAKNSWKLRVFGFGGCEVADREFWSNETNTPNKDCDAFRSAAIPQIQALHPNLVIVTSAGDHRLADGTVPTPAQLQDAWLSTFHKLAQPGTRLAMIGPIPYWPNDDARCLAAHVRNVQACSVATPELVTNNYEAPQASAAATAGVPFVSPRPWVCADRCEPVIADIRVYRENYHFTSAYAIYLAGALGEALQPAMA